MHGLKSDLWKHFTCTIDPELFSAMSHRNELSDWHINSILRHEWLLAVFWKMTFGEVAVSKALEGSAQKYQIASEIHTLCWHVRLFRVVDKDRCEIWLRLGYTLWGMWEGDSPGWTCGAGKVFGGQLEINACVCVFSPWFMKTQHAQATGLKLVNSKAHLPSAHNRHCKTPQSSNGVFNRECL